MTHRLLAWSGCLLCALSVSATAVLDTPLVVQPVQPPSFAHSLSIEDTTRYTLNNPYYRPPDTLQPIAPLIRLVFLQHLALTAESNSCSDSNNLALLWQQVRSDSLYQQLQNPTFLLEHDRPPPPPYTLLFYLFLVATCLVIGLRHSEEDYLEQTAQAVLNLNLSKQFFEAQLHNYQWRQSLLLYGILVSVSMIWGFLLLRQNDLLLNWPDEWVMATLGGVSFAYLGLRYVGLQLLGFIFLPLYEFIQFYYFNLKLINVWLALLLLPMACVAAFSESSMMTQIALYTLGGLMGLGLLYGIYRGWQIGKDFLLSYKFHFLLYLCAFEIAPLIISYTAIVKVL